MKCKRLHINSNQMKTFFLCSVFLFVVPFGFAQHSCNCENALKQLILKVETEYPGFQGKSKDKPVYDNFKKNLFKKARDTHDL